MSQREDWMPKIGWESGSTIQVDERGRGLAVPLPRYNAATLQRETPVMNQPTT